MSVWPRVSETKCIHQHLLHDIVIQISVFENAARLKPFSSGGVIAAKYMLNKIKSSYKNLVIKLLSLITGGFDLFVLHEIKIPLKSFTLKLLYGPHFTHFYLPSVCSVINHVISGSLTLAQKNRLVPAFQNIHKGYIYIKSL